MVVDALSVPESVVSPSDVATMRPDPLKTPDVEESPSVDATTRPKPLSVAEDEATPEAEATISPNWSILRGPQREALALDRICLIPQSSCVLLRSHR